MERKKTPKISRRSASVTTGDQNDSERTQVQSDIETRNLLDDVGEECDEDGMDLEEADGSPNMRQQYRRQLNAFEMNDEQLEYYSKCFLYLLNITQV